MSDIAKGSAILPVVLIAYVMMPIIGQSVNVALPAIGKSLSSNPVTLGWISISLFLSIAVFAVPAGRVADIYGRKKIFLGGTIICTATSFLLVFSDSAAALIVYRLIQGIGGAMILNTGLVIVSSAYPAGRRGKPLGLCMAAIYTGQTLAPFIGGLLTHHLGWRSIFAANVPFGLFVIGVTFWKVKDEWVEAPGGRIDSVGVCIFGTMIVLIIYGLSILPSTQGLWLFLAGIAFGAVFIKWELKADLPILEMKLFRENRAFSFSLLSAFIFYSGIFAVVFLLSLYLQYTKGLTAQKAGIVLVSQPFFQAVFSPIAGKLVDRVKPRRLALIGMSLATTGMLLLVRPDEIATLYRKRDEAENWQPGGDWVAQLDDTVCACHYGREPVRRGVAPGTILPGYVPGENPTLFSPQGGLRASVRDLSVIARMLLAGGLWDGFRILDEATVRAMRTPHWRYDAERINGDTGEGPNAAPQRPLFTGWGLSMQLMDPHGWGLGEAPRPLAGHLGDAYGLIGQFWLDFEHGDGLIALVTGAGDDPDRHPGATPLYRPSEEIMRWWLQHFPRGE